jgi:hypothetical protein
MHLWLEYHRPYLWLQRYDSELHVMVKHIGQPRSDAETKEAIQRDHDRMIILSLMRDHDTHAMCKPYFCTEKSQIVDN